MSMYRFVTRVLFYSCALALFCDALSNEGGDCTNGFISIDRIDRLLDNFGSTIPGTHRQRIYPEVGFTCSGSIKRCVFGANWIGGDLFPELQIWRPTGDDGVYTKVGYTTINTVRESSRLYEYSLSSPLEFQAGDVLGYYQPSVDESQLRLLSEDGGREPQLVYFNTMPTSPATELNISSLIETRTHQLLLNVVTDPPGCGCGFMRVERMRNLLNLEPGSPLIYPDERQQISPEMNLTCDGMITKWIIGAAFLMNRDLYPEFQMWRNVGDRVYTKIHSTSMIQFSPPPSDGTYVFDLLPVRSGDILGILIPPGASSKLRLRSEAGTISTQYFIPTDDTDTHYDVIDLDQISVSSSVYLPLVTVEFVRSSPSSVMTLSSPSLTSTATLQFTSPSPIPSTDQTSSGQSSAATLSIGVGVAVVLIAAVLILISVTVCLTQRKRKKKLITAENLAYGTSQGNMELKDNIAYTSTATEETKDDDDGKYDYVSRSDVTANFPVSINQAYGVVQS